MPALSIKQRRAMAIAEHHPGELYARNRTLTKMTHAQLHDYATTPEKNLPEKKAKRKFPGARGEGSFNDAAVGFPCGGRRQGN
jgi:hypothetical protein